jgi:hypothetical protein
MRQTGPLGVGWERWIPLRSEEFKLLTSVVRVATRSWRCCRRRPSKSLVILFVSRQGHTCMTQLDVAFRYGTPPGENELRALTYAREVYGIRKIDFDEEQNTVRVEYDATRLNDDSVAAILRRAGMDLREKVALV